MKTRLFILLLLGCWVLDTAAQTTIPSGLGFQVGYNRSLLREQGDPSELGTDGSKLPNVTALNGAKIGVIYDGTIVKGFGVMLGLNYTIAGTTGQWTPTTDKFNYPQESNSDLFQSFDLQIDWQYKFEIAKETYLILYTGPSIEYNFYFTRKHGTQASSTSEKKYDTYSLYSVDLDKDEKMDYTPLNITWGVGAGFQYQRYFLRGGYDFGIYNPYKDRFYNITSEKGYYNKGRLDSWSISVGMYLWEF